MNDLAYKTPVSGLLGDPDRDKYLTEFGKTTLTDRYLFTGETYQDLFIRVARAFADDDAHAERLYEYMSKGWFMPATPILSNGGTTRGLPISCFLNAVSDSLDGIAGVWNENVWLAARGGGIGTYWGDVREIGAPVGEVGQSSGIIPFVKVQDALTLAISQGSLRRGSSAAYLDINHPEIEEFLKIRKPTGGDSNRKCLNIHNGVVIDDAFMEKVINNLPHELISPKTKEVTATVSARELFNTILEMRVEYGEPYILFSDTVNNNAPNIYKLLGHKVKQSNLCSEIMLTTGLDFREKERTAVCCLSSVNLERYPDWKDSNDFIEDIMRFLDNVLENFIQRTKDLKGFEHARYSAMRERSVGLGVMGFHSFLQSINVPFESVMAKVWNTKLFTYLKEKTDAASKKLAVERGACPDAIACNILERFTHKMAIAPTSSISIICPTDPSACIEPIFANAYTQKTLSGSIPVRNANLEKRLEELGQNTEAVWRSIIENEGSVQHLDCLDEHDKLVYKTFIEIDQRWVIDHAADRADFIDQGQSLNLCVPGDIPKSDLVALHVRAWKTKKIKSLYYMRSLALNRAEKVSTKVERIENPLDPECLSCQ